jgi:hypothetical protein
MAGVAVFASFAKAGQFNRHPAENPRSFDFAQGRLCLSKNRTDKGRAPSAVRSEERLGQPPDPNFRIPYVLESSLEIQRELMPNTTITVGTMWTHGVHLLASNAYDKKLVPPTGTTTYYVCPAGVGQGTPGSPDPSAAICGGVTIDNWPES